MMFGECDAPPEWQAMDYEARRRWGITKLDKRSGMEKRLNTRITRSKEKIFKCLLFRKQAEDT